MWTLRTRIYNEGYHCIFALSAACPYSEVLCFNFASGNPEAGWNSETKAVSQYHKAWTLAPAFLCSYCNE